MRDAPAPFPSTAQIDVVPSRGRRLVLSTCVVVSMSLAASSCGSDKADTTAASTLGTTAAPSTSDGAAAFDLAAYCSAEIDLEMVGAGTGDPDEDPAGVGRVLLAAVGPVAEIAPPELVDDFHAVEQGLNSAVDTGDGSAIGSLDLSGIQAYGAANCGWTPITVTMTSFHFSGIPTELAAGDYDFAATNGSSEPHVLLVLRKQDGVTASWDDLLAGPEGQEQVETVAATFAAPGQTGHSIARLEPGEYLVMCPIQQGATMDSEGTGPPHFQLGMQQVINVTG